MRLAIIVHGGAKEVPPEKQDANREGCIRAAEAGWAVLERGGSAIEAVEVAIRLLEDDPVYNAGLGSELNEDGDVQMDAAIMEGRRLQAGAVGFIQGVRHPISVAAQVLREEEVFLVGNGAHRFAQEVNAELCDNKDLEIEEKRKAWEEKSSGKANNTVGCVAFDHEGLIVTGASTGGTGHNRRGRIGDTPQLGCGVYADNTKGACAMTGDGEEIARLAMAKAAVDMLGSECPDCVGMALIKDMEKRVGGEAGCILIDSEGTVGWFHNSKHMPVAYRSSQVPSTVGYLQKGEELVV